MNPEFWNIYELLRTSWEVPLVLPFLLPGQVLLSHLVWGSLQSPLITSADQIFFIKPLSGLLLIEKLNNCLWPRRRVELLDLWKIIWHQEGDPKVRGKDSEYS